MLYSTKHVTLTVTATFNWCQRQKLRLQVEYWVIVFHSGPALKQWTLLSLINVPGRETQLGLVYYICASICDQYYITKYKFENKCYGWCQDVDCNSHWNGKQARQASSMLTKMWSLTDNTDNRNTSTDIIFTCIHSRNARGCEYGRRETLVQCCYNAGPSSSMAAWVWCLVAAYRVHVYSPWWWLLDLPHFPNQ